MKEFKSSVKFALASIQLLGTGVAFGRTVQIQVFNTAQAVTLPYQSTYCQVTSSA